MEFIRKAPVEMAFYEALLRRAVVDERVQHDMQAKYMQLRTGFAGERRVDREWREVNVPGLLLHDFTCRNEFGHTHQIDTIFVCKHFILVVEVKNVSGRIDFDDARCQFLRTREDGKVESFMNPVDQVKRHRELLVNESLAWSEYVPVEAAVVIANPSTVIGRLSTEVPVFNVSGLRTKVQELVKKYAAVQVNPRVVKGYLEALYEPIERTRTRADLPYSLRQGVLCLSCGKVMHHGFKGFVCVNCGTRDRDGAALRMAMHDFRVLYGDHISNREFREFCGVGSWRTANEMLKKLFSNFTGEKKSRKYIIPSDIGRTSRKLLKM